MEEAICLDPSIGASRRDAGPQSPPTAGPALDQIPEPVRQFQAAINGFLGDLLAATDNFNCAIAAIVTPPESG